MKKIEKNRWIYALSFQILFILGISIIGVFIPFLFIHGAAIVETAVQLVILPICGGVSAYVATRKGLNNFAAILAPSLLMAAAYLLIIGMLPDHMGGVFLCALVSIVGASAGEVVNMRKRRGKQ